MSTEETTQEGTIETAAPNAEATENLETKIETAPLEEKEPISTKDAVAAVAEKATKAREIAEKAAGGKPGDVPAPAFTANLKYKVMDKEHEIPKEFAGLIKDAESEKKVREIFERSTGLDVVKENLTLARNERDQARKGHFELNSQVNDLKSTYQAAIQSGDMHKLDAFWKKLDIPQDVLMEYALAKVKLQELPAEQRNAVLAKQNAEFQAEEIRRQQATLSTGYLEQRQQMTQMMLDQTLMQPKNQAAAADFEARVGKPGMFREEVRRWGEQEWLRSQGRNYMPPDQVVAAVIQHYGLNTEGKPVVTEPVAPAPNRDPRQNVIVKPVQTIPNLGGGGSQSPLKSKPKSIEDLKKMATRAANGEAV